MDSYRWLLAVQPVPIAVVLGWAGTVKLTGRRSPAAAARTALHRIVGETAAPRAYRGLGGVELAVAAALLVPALRLPAALGAVGLATGFAGYLSWARAVAPDSSCGCLSSRASRITWRALARAGLLLGLGLAALVAGLGQVAVGGGRSGWLGALAGHPVAALVAVLGELAVVVALSAELDRYWLLPLRRARLRLSHPLATGGFDVPLESSVQQLERSPAFARVGAALRSGIQDSWDEGEWRVLSYAAVIEGKRVTVVFAVPRLRYAPADVRMAVVDEADGRSPELVDA
jgi:methylamine utilization protein MauE